MRHILYEHKYCGFFLAKRIFRYRDEEWVQYSSHKETFEYRDEENPHALITHPTLLIAMMLIADIKPGLFTSTVLLVPS
jgi:hypothetical protein